MKITSSLALASLLLFAMSACGDSNSGDGGRLTDDGMEDTTADGAVNDPCPSLIGSWELDSIAETAPALTGVFVSDPNYQESPTLKILNETHWMFIRQSAEQFVHAQGGRYTIEPGGFYTEYVEYSAIPENIGQSFEFECLVEGDTLWHHVGGQGDTRYDERWRRVK